MNIEIREEKKELQVIIECKKADEKVLRLRNHLELFNNKLQAKADSGVCFVNTMDALYFESVDDKVFLYTEGSVMEVRQRLYELEELLSDKDFIRISKSVIVNINRIATLRPELNRTLLLTMCSGEQLVVSRNYVKGFRGLLGI